MEKLLLLHGALGSSQQFSTLIKKLNTNFEVYAFNFSGHGGRVIHADPFSIEMFAGEVLSWMKDNGLKQVNIFGYSMGGYVGLYLAKKYPEKIKKLATLATKFIWDKAIAEKEYKLLDPKKIEEKIPAFAEQLNQRHLPEDWKKLMKKTGEMMIGMGNENPISDKDLGSVTQKILLCVGEQDNMVSAEETESISKKIKNSRFLLMSDTPHPFEKVSVEQLASELKLFFGS
jgi:pimeloyl-ACP methyl ester carboxylesterase